MIDGACIAIESDSGKSINEITRLRQLGLELEPEQALSLPYFNKI
jgi:hypothetical protein